MCSRGLPDYLGRLVAGLAEAGHRGTTVPVPLRRRSHQRRDGHRPAGAGFSNPGPAGGAIYAAGYGGGPVPMVSEKALSFGHGRDDREDLPCRGGRAEDGQYIRKSPEPTGSRRGRACWSRPRWSRMVEIGAGGRLTSRPLPSDALGGGRIAGSPRPALGGDRSRGRPHTGGAAPNPR